MKELPCRDLGYDCETVVRADTEDELMAQVRRHARDVHGIDALGAETEEEARALVREA